MPRPLASLPGACLALLLALLALPAARAELTMSNIFGDHMVLQRDTPLPVWGTAKPGEAITVSLGAGPQAGAPVPAPPPKTASTTADAQGAWRVTLPPVPATADGESLVLTVAGQDAHLMFTDVLVGEVWLGSGQSNMEMMVMSARNGEAEVAASADPQLRQFTVMHQLSPAPLTDCEGQWRAAHPDTTGSFSAVGYFFARALRQRLHVPVGVINSSWGGTPIQGWLSLPAHQAIPAMQERLAKIEKLRAEFDQAAFKQARTEAMGKYREKQAAWLATLEATDPAMQAKWYLPSTAVDGWRELTMPQLFLGDLHNYTGFVWARKDVTIPAAWVGQDLEIGLGAIDECDIAYANGVAIGRTWYEMPDFWTTPRVYRLPAAAVTSTTVSVVVRLYNVIGDIGFMGPAKRMAVRPVGAPVDGEVVSLAGPWRVQSGVKVAQKDTPMFAYPDPPGVSAGEPSCLYNGMIAPLTPFALRGALWYQGEANAGEPDLYRQLLPALIADWRKVFGRDFAFGIVQLAGFMALQKAPMEHGWAELRETQRQTALTVPHTGIVAATDIGDAGDIHPKNKQEVGRRLALWASATVYGQQLEWSGPTFAAMKAEDGGTVRVTFDHAAGLHAPAGVPVRGFALAGEDQVFHAATATLGGASVILTAPQVPAPVAVRYAWANLPYANLLNGDDLPALAFRSDTWPFKDATGVVDEPTAAPVK